MTIAGTRSILAAVFMLAIRLAYSRHQKNKTTSIAAMLKQAPMLAVFGMSYTATMILFVIANKLTASANAIMLQYASPIWAALLGWFFLKEKPRWEHWCALVLVSLGMFWVFSDGLSTGALLGDILALISGITFGANSIALRARKEGNTADILLFAHILCALIAIPFFFMHPPSLNAQSILSIILMGFFQLGLASVLFAYGIKRVPAVQAMLTATIEPVMNPVWVLLVTGERPAFSVIAGGSLIIAAVIFSSTLSALRRRN